MTKAEKHLDGLDFAVRFFRPIVYYSTFLLHLASIVAAFVHGGFLGAILTLLTPILSSAFWAWKLRTSTYSRIGTFVLAAFFTYTLALMARGVLAARIPAIARRELYQPPPPTPRPHP